MATSAGQASDSGRESIQNSSPDTGREPNVPPPQPREQIGIELVRLAYSQAQDLHASKFRPSVKKAGRQPKPEPPVQKGLASWYGDEFKGKKMSNGRKFDPNRITVAHKRFELDRTILKITNPKNGISIIAPVTDRGPFKPGRDLDLSKAAFKALGADPKKGLLIVTYKKL